MKPGLFGSVSIPHLLAFCNHRRDAAHSADPRRTQGAIVKSPLRPRLCFLPKTNRRTPRRDRSPDRSAAAGVFNPRAAHKKEPSPLGKVAREARRKRSPPAGVSNPCRAAVHLRNCAAKRGRLISVPTTQPQNFCAEDSRAILQSPLRPRLCFLPKTKRRTPRRDRSPDRSAAAGVFNPRAAQQKRALFR